MGFIATAECILNAKLHQHYEFTSLIIALKKKSIQQTLHKLIYMKFLHWVHKTKKVEPEV